MKKKFNLSAYKQLLELEENGKISFLDEKYNELCDYRESVQVQIMFNLKADYLIEKYLNRVVAPHEFRLKFLEMEKQALRTADTILQDFRELENFTLAENIDKFPRLIGKIYDLCFDFYEVGDGGEPMSETKFRSLVNNYYLQLQEAFSFENFDSQVYKHLVSRSFKILRWVIGLEILLIFYNI